MERYVHLFKRNVINFKLKLCCFMLRVRSGLLAFACLHIAIGVSSLMFFAEESFEPLLLKALNGVAEEGALNYGPSCMIVYAVELGSNVVLLCGIIRNDMVLLRVYMYFALGVLTAALMTYSVMFVPQELNVKFLIVFSIAHQIYILLLLRSAMIEIKLTLKQDDYKVRYRHSSIKYLPGSDRYSVVIEPYRRRSSVASMVPYVREPYRRSSSLVPVYREPYRRNSSLVPYVREEPYRSSVQENRPIVTEVADEKVAVTVHSPAKEEVAKEVVDKEEVDKLKEKEVKAKEVKLKRSFFGRKENAKQGEKQDVTSEA